MNNNQVVEDKQQNATQKNNDSLSINTIATAIVVLLPVFGTVIAIALLFYSGISWLEVLLFLSMYLLTMIGSEIGFHRYFAHNSFKTTSIVEAILAILGLMSAQGALFYWVVEHPRHHKYSDVPGDIHSPHLHGVGFVNKLRGLYHAHIGWVFDIANAGNTDSLLDQNLLKNPLILKFDQLQLVWILLGLVIPAFIEGIITWSWMGAFKGFLWGGLVRIFLVQQFIGSLNSICHFYGRRPFKCKDYSTNNIWLAIPTLGQSWHNNHHAFPNSAIIGLKWWQIDLGSWIIWVLEKTGLVWDVKRPTESMIAARKLPT